jgi:hypothetical protein
MRGGDESRRESRTAGSRLRRQDRYIPALYAAGSDPGIGENCLFLASSRADSGQRMAGLGRVARSAAPTGHPPRGGCDGGMAEASSARNAITRQEERGFGVPAHVPAIHSRSGACRRFPDTPDP